MPKFEKLMKESALSAEVPRSRSELDAKLAEVTASLARWHQQQATAKRSLDECRSEFFELATEYIKQGDLDRQVVAVPDYIEGWLTTEEWVSREYPGYYIIQDTLIDRVKPAVVIEEDPAKKAFTWTNNALGFTFTRTVRMVKGGFDVDALVRLEDDRLADNVTDEVVSYEFNEAKAVEWVTKHPEDLPRLQKYAYEGQPQMTLGTPRKVNDDE